MNEGVTHADAEGVDLLSMCAIPLRIMSNGHVLSVASAFMIAHAGSSYLVTNWHVASGRNADNGELLSSTGATPDALEVWLQRKGVRSGHNAQWWEPITIPLLSVDGAPQWHEHELGPLVDVVLIPLGGLPSDVITHHLPPQLNTADIHVGVGSRVFILGYPFGMHGGGLYPVWKAGHIASEPCIDYQELPLLLVDATTRAGMSGSLVIHRFDGFGYRTRAYAERTATGISPQSSVVDRFVGVYSGRIHGEAELGRVWKPSVIEDIIKLHLS